MTRVTGQRFGKDYRRLSEDAVVDMLVLEGHAYEPDRQTARDHARSALRRFVEMGLPTARNEAGLLYDPVEVACFIKQVSRNADDDYWRTHQVATLRRFVTDLADEAPAHLSLRATRSFDVRGVPAGESRRLRMPLPLERHYSALEITPELPEEADRHRVSDGRLEAKVTAAGASGISIGARIELDLAPVESEDLTESDLYLRGQEGLVLITPQIAALSHRLAGNAGAENALKAFWLYLIENFMFCPIHYDQVPADAPLDWVLRTGVYDCQLASSLLIGLARARGIPARLVGGNFLYRRSPTNHYWAEIWLENEGWFPVDSIGWDLSGGGEDSDWRDHFFGRLDARLIAECQPKNFVGTIGLSIPDQWTMLRAPMEHGAAVSLATLDGREVYRDEIEIF